MERIGGGGAVLHKLGAQGRKTAMVGTMDVKHETKTRQQYRAYAEHEARRMLGVSYDEAMNQLRSGDLEGSLAATRLRMMSSMLESDPALAAE
jgi:hypothetical protein